MMREVTRTLTDQHAIATYRQAAERHRNEHCCGGYPFDDGERLQRLIREASARRVLELGTATGFSAFCFATASSEVQIDSIDRDTSHVAMATERLAAYGLADRVRVHQGEFADVLATLAGPYDLVFVDGFEADPALLDRLVELADGMLVNANLSWSATTPAILRRLDELGWDTRRERDIAISLRRSVAA
jgi:predicted O-methyltransferase YrrM